MPGFEFQSIELKRVLLSHFAEPSILQLHKPAKLRKLTRNVYKNIILISWSLSACGNPMLSRVCIKACTICLGMSPHRVQSVLMASINLGDMNLVMLVASRAAHVEILSHNSHKFLKGGTQYWDG
eukprot:Gb_23554 [translate_table: standard]